MKNEIRKKLLLMACVMTMLLTACTTTNANNKEITTEPSTRIPNSVVGRWYQCDDPDWLMVWVFQEDGIYYSDEEEWIDKEDESYSIARYKYSIDGNTIILDGREATIEYTDYGFNIQYLEASSEYAFYEYRQDALESCEGYWTSDTYYETLKDKNGYVIKDGVLIKYFTDKKKIIIPDNVTEIGKGIVIVMEAMDEDGFPERIDKLTIPGSVKKIGAGAFGETSLGCVIIEEGVEEIGAHAFADSYCEEIYIPESVKSIGEDAFSCYEGNYDGKIYVKKGSYAEEYFKENNRYDGEIVVKD